MEMVQATILEQGIEDMLWPEVVLAMTYVKNLWQTQVLEKSINLIKKQDNTLFSLQYPHVLGSTIYVFLHKKEHVLKSAKWDVRALKGNLIRFDGHTIYRVHVKE